MIELDSIGVIEHGGKWIIVAREKTRTGFIPRFYLGPPFIKPDFVTATWSDYITDSRPYSSYEDACAEALALKLSRY